MKIDQDEEGDQFELIEKFIEIIKQEDLHSSLLLFQGEAFDALRDVVKDQQKRLKEYLVTNEEEEIRLTDKNFRYMIYSAELDKVQYLLKMYLRIRLKKIQLYSFHFMKHQQDAERLMSVAELKFMKKYSEVRFHYYRQNVFNNFLKNYRDFKEIDSLYAKTEAERSKEKKVYVQTNQSLIDLKAPNPKEYVFAQILSNPQHLRFGIDMTVSNVSSENMEVIPINTMIFSPIKAVQERFDRENYRLI